MEPITRRAVTKALTPGQIDLDAINALTLRPLTLEAVYCFRLIACDDQVDRDFEAFSLDALRRMAQLFVGKTVLRDHEWSAAQQCARVYAAAVELIDTRHCLVLRCYIPRGDDTAPMIRAIETGILHECSVGLSLHRRTCAICGKEIGDCGHRRGETYDGKLCHYILSDVDDVYEVSLVAVPAQPGAGTIKGAKPKADPSASQSEQVIRMRLRIAKR